MFRLPVPMIFWEVPLQSILSLCPALKHLSLHQSHHHLTRANRREIHARFWHAFKTCANLSSLTLD